MTALAASLDRALRVAEAAPEGYARAVASDADGTLWAGDVADTLFLDASTRGLFQGEGLAHFLAGARAVLGDGATGDPRRDGPAVLDAYARGAIDITTLCNLQTQSLGGRSLASLDALLEGAAETVAARIHPEVRRLLAETAARGWPLHVVSGSLGRLVARTLTLAAIPFASVSGGVLKVEGDWVHAALAGPIPLHAHKIDALKAQGAWPPALGLGDGGWDAPFLHGAFAAALIEPKPALRDAMREHPRCFTL
ncbi:MAG: haloacid dehalogenase-like hydrolase [Myxococcales bacterium]|nr:haloacid dehalogenase-like hydrolase [Myxococcales bacterium]